MTAGVRITGIEPTKTPTLPTSNLSQLQLYESNRHSTEQPCHRQGIKLSHPYSKQTVYSSRTSKGYHHYPTASASATIAISSASMRPPHPCYKSHTNEGHAPVKRKNYV